MVKNVVWNPRVFNLYIMKRDNAYLLHNYEIAIKFVHLLGKSSNSEKTIYTLSQNNKTRNY